MKLKGGDYPSINQIPAGSPDLSYGGKIVV
jgi:hypothetical protein